MVVIRYFRSSSFLDMCAPRNLMMKTRRRAVTQANVVMQPANEVTQANASKSIVKVLRNNLMYICFVLNAVTLLCSNFAPLIEISKDTGLGVAISELLPSKIKDSEVTTVKYDGLMARNLFVERPLLLQQIIYIMNRKEDNNNPKSH